MVYTLRFFPSSKCSLFHNSNVFGSCIIHILYAGCAKIKKIILALKGYKKQINGLGINSALQHDISLHIYFNYIPITKLDDLNNGVA